MRVLLVCMPFAELDRPALGLSTLKACVVRSGISCDVAYLSLDFAGLLGREDYARIAHGMPLLALAGEWVFAAALWDSAPSTWREYADGVLARGPRLDAADVEALRSARALASGFLDDALSSLSWSEYQLVGFTSSGSQNTAALALARRIKERHPAVNVVFGGHNWAGSMGMAQHGLFPWVDFAFTGEADQSFPLLLRALDGDECVSAESISGLVRRTSGGTQSHNAARPVRDLDDLPLPDHSDYFERLARGGVERRGPVTVPVEMSRGCWWAARSPCVFCGLNGEPLAYRAKDAYNMRRELSTASALGAAVEIVDNVVPPRFLEDVLPTLAAEQRVAGLSFKVRPDVDRRHVEDAAAAGATLMCGIETLSDRLLVLLGKGVGSACILELLRWCAALGLEVRWNMLWGIPGERPEDYAEQVELIPHLRTLGPPGALSPIVLERHSTLWHEAAERDRSSLRAARAYAHVYPVASHKLSEIAYFFEQEYRPGVETLLQIHRLARRVTEWQNAWAAA